MKASPDLFKNLTESYEAMRPKWIQLSVRVCRRYPFKETNANIMYLRNAILHRLESLFHHLDLYLENQAQIRKLLQTGQDPMDYEFHRKSMAKTMVLFEDIIFGVISCFDYVGNFLACLYISPSKNKIQWSGFSNSCRDKGNPMYKHKIAEKVREIEKGFLGHLGDYRAQIIHNINDETTGHAIYNGDTISFHVNIPKKFLRISKKISGNIDEKADMVTQIAYVLSKCLQYNTEMLDIAINDHAEG